MSHSLREVCLGYCIFRHPAKTEQRTVFGLGGKPVYLVTQNGLSAAVSKICHSDLTYEISQILAYEKVIESFHLELTVIPMRYGCLFEKEFQAIRLLEKDKGQYESLLEELDGCVEMGIRVLWQEERQYSQRLNIQESGLVESKIDQNFSLAAGLVTEGKESGSSLLSNIDSWPPNPWDEQVFTGAKNNPGRAYLDGIRERYSNEDRALHEQEIIREKICNCLAGLFVRSRKENSLVAGRCLLSFYFLVPRKSVEPFRQAFQHISLNESAKLLLSGPWPPYNFVLSNSLENLDLLRG